MIHKITLHADEVVEIIKAHLSAKYDVKDTSFYVFKAEHHRETDYFSVTATVEEKRKSA